MTTSISAQVFFKEWCSTVEKRKDQMIPIWRKPAEYTSYIISAENSVLSEIARKLNLKSYLNDYYSIDSILYDDNCLVPGRPESTFWFRDVIVAFEHENDFNSGLYKEVSHLLITNCELRVLVTYPNYEPDQELSFLHKIILGSKHSTTISESESFLIILGYENGFSWEGYLYKLDGWQKLKC